MNIGNTAKRIIVSVMAIPVILAACIIGKLFLTGFVLAIGLAAFYEFSLMVKNKAANVNMAVGFPAVASVILNAYYGFMDPGNLIMIIALLLLVFELFRNNGSAITNFGAALAGVVYMGFFPSCLVRLREFYADEYINGGLLIIGIFISIWICDSAAFFIGSKFGKHKLFPRVSPKKSWEGAVAGFAFAVIAMIIQKYLFLAFLSDSMAVSIGIIAGSIGQIGDLTESLLKRDAGVKDSSNLIPGHGGVFDRFDSLFITAPVVYVVLYYLS